MKCSHYYSKFKSNGAQINFFWITILLLSSINIVALYNACFFSGELSVPVKILSAVSDSLCLFFPFIFFRKKWILCIPIWFCVLSFIEFINVLYFRNFNDVISGIAYFSSGSVNNFVISSGIASIKGIDLVFVITTIVVILATQKNIHTLKTTKQFKIVYTVLLITFLSLQTSLSMRRIHINNKLNWHDSISEYFDSFKLRTSWKSYLRDYGLSGYLIRVGTEILKIDNGISSKDLALIDSFWIEKQILPPLPFYIDSLCEHNQGKNLIIIIVESLNSKLLTTGEAVKIVPFLKQLTNDKEVIYFPSVTAQTSHGRSSDGQFIYNTGLLPLADEALVNRYASANYPSIAKLLNGQSMEIIGEERSLWSHAITSVSYGYDKLIDNIATDNIPISQRDSLIFDAAIKEVNRLRSPFLLEITTIGMHKPYNNKTNEPLSLSGQYDSKDQHYFEAAHIMDRSLKKFIDYLKSSGIYNQSIIVITSDHEESYPLLSHNFNEKLIPFIILNSGINFEADASRQYYQMDVFPTMLDVMGMTSSSVYHGIGNSMLRLQDGDTLNMDYLWDMSAKTIKSKRFPPLYH